jgi:hypothetical protein
MLRLNIGFIQAKADDISRLLIENEQLRNTIDDLKVGMNQLTIWP